MCERPRGGKAWRRAGARFPRGGGFVWLRTTGGKSSNAEVAAIVREVRLDDLSMTGLSNSKAVIKETTNDGLC